jgi:tripartite-type tricarboxylate transporter receptor subunit TctC
MAISRRGISRRVMVGLPVTAALGRLGEAAGQTPDEPVKPARRPQPAPIRIVVPFPAGGPTDAVARVIAAELRSDLRRAVIVENKPGASGTIGTRYALTSSHADGTVLLIGNNQTMATAPYLIPDAGYNPRTDLQPVSGLVDMHHVLVVRNGLDVRDVAGLIALAKSSPGKLNYGSTGIGSGSHLAMELFMTITGTRMQHVPFQGAGQLAGEIAAERLDLALAVLPTVVGPVSGGSMRALAVAGRERAPQLPSVPTLEEAGVADAAAESWLALFVNARVPDNIVQFLDVRIRRILARAAVKSRLEGLGLSVAPRSSEEFRVFHGREIARWGDVVAKADMRAR